MKHLSIVLAIVLATAGSASAQVVGKRTTVAAGADFSCVVVSGAVKCWGGNSVGQLGRGTTSTFEVTPATISSLSSGVTAVAAGGQTACAIKSGDVYCWGNNNVGQVGDGTVTNRSAPVLITLPLGAAHSATDVSVGDMNACAINDRRGSHQVGQLFCWGYNGDGEVGDNTQTDRHSPAGPISTNTDSNAHQWIMVSCGGTHTTGISDQIEDLPTATPTPHGWGDNSEGQLGSGTTSSGFLQPRAMIIPNETGYTKWHAVDISAQEGTSCVIDTTTTAHGIYCAGANVYLRMTYYGWYNATILGVGASAYHMCVQTTSGLLCWGDDSFGQIGVNSPPSSYAAAYIGTTFTSFVAMGAQHTLSYASGDPTPGGPRGAGFYAWGYGVNGRLGIDPQACYANLGYYYFGQTICKTPAGPISGL